MRKLLTSLLLLMPLVAAGQTLDGVSPTAATVAAEQHVAAYGSLQLAQKQDDGSMLLPLWRDADGRMLALVGSSDPQGPGAADVLDFRVVDVSQGYRSGLRYDIGPHVAAYAQLTQRSWLTPSATCRPSNGIGCPDASVLQAARLLSGEIGASYSGKGYRFDVLFGSSRPRVTTSPLLPRVLPQSPTAIVPLWALDNSTNLTARGRLALGGQTGLDLGASVGRIRLLPGNLLGVDALGQRSLSLGVDRGSLSGHITGRIIQPMAGNGVDGLLGNGRSWTTIDLGVTWRLPWQGELRFGAQNLWSSGQSPVPVQMPDAGKSRIPYVQYHQDL